MTGIPEGFDLLQRSSPLTLPWQPIYARRSEGAIILGLRAGEPHLNSRGFVHGGLIAALVDNAMGYSCHDLLGGGVDLVTVGLSVDYIAPAREGQWLTFETDFIKEAGRLVFARALVLADSEPCARANGTFSARQARGA